LINLGEEEGKGNILTQATYPLLKENSQLNFIGNVEGRDLYNGKIDVIVADGFVGNVALKISEGVANLVEAARRNGISRFVQESFALTYPDRADAWIDEQTPIDPAAYSKTVSDAERSVADFCAQGYTGVVLRFAAFYGPDAMQVKSYINGLRWGWALLPGGPDRFISSISHDDAASAVVAALEASQGIYNVADDQPVRRARYFELLASNLGLKSPNFVPEWATPMFGSVGQAMSRSLRLSNAKLRGATRWRPRFPSVREGWPAMLRDMGYGPAAPGR